MLRETPLMPDDPHRHPDGSFVVAAETQVTRLIKANRVNRIFIYVLSAVTIALVVVATVLGINLHRTSQLSQKVQQGAISSCLAGNAQRANDTQIWDAFITLILKGNTDPADIQEGKDFEQYIARVDAPRNCKQTYTVNSAMKG